MTERPFIPPELSMRLDQAALWSALASHAGRPLPLAGGGMTATFAVAEAPAASLPVVLVETTGGQRAFVAVTSFPFKAMFSSDLAATELFELPVALRDAIYEGMLALLWAALPEHKLGTHRIAAAGAIGALSERIGATALRWLAISVAGIAPEPVALLVGAETSTFAGLVTGGRLAPNRIWTGLKSRLTADVAHVLGSLTLPVAELASLHPGDVVVLPAQAAGAVTLRSGDLTIELTGSGGRWTVARRSQDRRFRPPNDGARPMDDGPSKGAALKDLPVVLDFELGRRSVPLADIESWQAGTVVPIDAAEPKEGVEVTVRANGEVVGLGDLVRIDDRIAVRLTRLFVAK